MITNITQEHMKTKYIQLLEDTMKEIKSIDDFTPYESDIEPIWWLDMMNLKVNLRKRLIQFGKVV